jgi:hypothetical protein
VTRRLVKRREPWLLGVLRVLGAAVAWFLFTGLFTVVLMALGVKR